MGLPAKQNLLIKSIHSGKVLISLFSILGCSINFIPSGEPGFKEQQGDKLQGHGRGEITMRI